MGASPLQTYSALSASLKENSSLDSVTRSPRHIRSHAVRGEDLRVGRGHRVSSPSSFLESHLPLGKPPTLTHPHTLGGRSADGGKQIQPLIPPLLPARPQPLWSSESQVLLLFLGLCSCHALRPDILPRLQVITGPTSTAEASAHLSSSLGAPSRPRPLNLPPVAVSVALLLPGPSRCQTSSSLFAAFPAVSPSTEQPNISVLNK